MNKGLLDSDDSVKIFRKLPGVRRIFSKHFSKWDFRSEQVSRKSDIFLTINSDLAVTIRVTGLKEGLCLTIGQSSGTMREVLQEQPEEDDRGTLLSDLMM